MATAGHRSTECNRETGGKEKEVTGSAAPGHERLPRRSTCVPFYGGGNWGAGALPNSCERRSKVQSLGLTAYTWGFAPLWQGHFYESTVRETNKQTEREREVLRYHRDEPRNLQTSILMYTTLLSQRHILLNPPPPPVKYNSYLNVPTFAFQGLMTCRLHWVP